jgi:hypothetical protein
LAYKTVEFGPAATKITNYLLKIYCFCGVT